MKVEIGARLFTLNDGDISSRDPELFIYGWDGEKPVCPSCDDTIKPMILIHPWTRVTTVACGNCLEEFPVNDDRD